MTPPLSDAALQRVRQLFRNDEELVCNLLLTECGHNLPGLGALSPNQMDRWRFAVLELSAGDLAKLDQALRLANLDWRDLLMAAEYGERE